MVGFGHPWLLFLLPFVLGWIYWTYARRRPPVVPAAGVWLVARARARGRAFRRFDLRLLALLLAGAATVLALAAPSLHLGRPRRIVVVVDASASMAARDASGASRLDRAREKAASWLRPAHEAVLVRAGLEPRTFGPASGRALERVLADLQAGDAAAYLARAVASGRALLPGAPVLVVGDAPPPEALGAGFLDFAGHERNAGLTALGPRFAAVYNAGPTAWEGVLESEGERRELRLGPDRFYATTFESARPRRTARIAPADALALDQVALVNVAPPRVRLLAEAPAAARALKVLGARISERDVQGEVRIAQPPPTPAPRPTLYFAPEAAAPAAPVFDVDPTHPFTRSVELVGFRLPPPPPPSGEGWRVLAALEDGAGLAYARGGELYLPPLRALQDLPAFVALVHNWLAPQRPTSRPLGWRGVRVPGLHGGQAVNLLSYRETRLPRPTGDRSGPVTARRPLAPWLALLAAVLLVAQAPRRRLQAVG
ncbi:MAG TPA: VWA domain-containing protein [Oceanithermus profundus]|uniref:VWA domain-containing protein n=1 Tax=Oceanithermus profundus TaxID=187137 RepID=A0A7C4ZGS7_9DEIN|nr:VWA domain-containing protein [Oceanithermus profundus]